ncbi:MAG: ATP-binding protein [Nitrospinota bacterium]
MGVFSIIKSLEMYQDGIVKNLKSRTDWQMESINKNLQSIIGNIYFLSELPSLKRTLQGKSNNIGDLERDILEFSRGHRHYGKIRVIDFTGEEVVRANNKNGKLFLTSSKELEFLGNTQHFQKCFTLSKGDVEILPMEVDTGRDFLSQQIVEVITPIYKDKTKLGIIMAQLYAFELFEWIHLPDAPFVTLLLDSKGKILHIHEHISGVGIQKEVVAGSSIGELFSMQNGAGAQPVKEGLSYVDEGAIVIRSVHLNNGNEPSWFIATFFPESYMAMYAANMKWYLAVTIMLVTLAAALTAMYLTKRFKKSFNVLNRGMENITTGNFDDQLKLESGDEFEEAADKLEEMRLHIKENQDTLINQNRDIKSRLDYYKREVHTLEHQLYRADKLASVGELSLKLAHEIGNPLASIKTVTQVMSEKVNGNDGNSEYFSKIVSEVDRLTLFLKKFNSFAVIKERRMAACDLSAMVRDVNFFLKVQAVEKGVSIEENFGVGSMQIYADIQQIKQLLMNLTLNAIQATDATGRIRISLSNRDEPCDCMLREGCFCENERLGLEQNSLVALSICDTGKGIKKSDLSKIFNPYFTTKSNGTGIGLSIAQKIVESHKGSLKVYSAEGEGTTFKVYLPKHKEVLI